MKLQTDKFSIVDGYLLLHTIKDNENFRMTRSLRSNKEVLFKYNDSNEIIKTTITTDHTNHRFEIEYFYDNKGNIIAVKNGDIIKLSMNTYDGHGNLILIKQYTNTYDEDVSVRITYNDKNLPIKFTYSNNTIIDVEYDGDGRVICYKNSRGYKNCYYYDIYGKLIYQEDNTRRKVRYFYKNGNIVLLIYKDNDGYYSKTRYEYDEYGNCIKETNNTHDVRIYEFEPIPNYHESRANRIVLR